MTINTSTNRVVQTGNGATTVWNYGFLIPDATEVVVQITDKTTGVVTTLTNLQYSITGIGNPSGGTVTYTPALTTNQTITITRILPVIQGTSLNNQGAFYPVVVETALDYLTMITQQLNDSIGRSLQISPNGVATIDAQNNRIINVATPVAATDAARITDVQAAQAVANAVPTPILADVGRFLRATGVGAYAWTTFLSSMISDATAAGLALLTGANAAAQRSSLGLGALATLNTVGNAQIDANAIAASNVQANVLTFAKFQRTGSLGQVWQSNGAGADPSYVGSMTLITNGVVSGAGTLDIALPSGYKRFILMADDFLPANTNNGVGLRVSLDNGSTYKSAAADYTWSMIYTNTGAGSGPFDSSTGSTTYINIGATTTGAVNTAGVMGSYILEIYPGAVGKRSTIFQRAWQALATTNAQAHGAGNYTATGVITNIRLFFTQGGNIATGTWELYGVV